MLEIMSRPWLLAMALVATLLASNQPASARERLADAKVLNEHVVVTIDARGRAIERGLRTVLANTDAGVQLATSDLVLYPHTEFDAIQATIQLPDGRKVEVEDTHIVERPLLDDAIGRQTRLVHVPFARATAGSRMTVSWQRRLDSLLYLRDWVFRDELPIEQTSYEISFPKAFPLRFRTINGDIEPETRESGDERTLVFKSGEAAPLAIEPMAPPISYLRGRVQFFSPLVSYAGRQFQIEQWSDVGEFYGKLAAGRYELEKSIAREFQQLGKKTKDKRSLVASIYARLRSFEYQQVYLENGGYQPHAAMWTWNRQFGDCKDLTTLLLAMLRHAGIESYPVLTRVGIGDPFSKEHPSPRQFDHAIAYVPLGATNLLIDATVPSLALGTIPGLLSSKPALIVRDDGNHELIELPAAKPDEHAINAELTLSVAPHGGVSGDLHTTMSGDYHSFGANLAASASLELSGPALALVSGASEGRVTDLLFAVGDTEVTLDAAYSSSRVLMRAGDRTFLSPSRFAFASGVPAFAGERRSHPVVLGTPHTSNVRVSLATNGPTVCPPPVEHESAFGRYVLRCESSTDSVGFVRMLATTRERVEAEEYAAAARFFRAIARADQSLIRVP